MKTLKKISLVLVAMIFCLSMFVASGSAQPGHAKWRGNSGKHKGWDKGRHKGWDKGRKRGWRPRLRVKRRYRRRH